MRVFILGALSRDEARNYLNWLADSNAKEATALTALEDSSSGMTRICRSTATWCWSSASG
jgi:hypothetical protein